jgi:hypothetical protein
MFCKGSFMFFKTLHRKQWLSNTDPLRTGGNHMCSGRISNFCSTSDTRRDIVKRLEHKEHKWTLTKHGLTRKSQLTWVNYHYKYIDQSYHSIDNMLCNSLGPSIWYDISSRRTLVFHLIFSRVICNTLIVLVTCDDDCKSCFVFVFCNSKKDVPYNDQMKKDKQW